MSLSTLALVGLSCLQTAAAVSAVDPSVPKLMRRDPALLQGTPEGALLDAASFANSSSASEDQEMLRIVYDSLRPMNGQVQVQAQMDRVPPTQQAISQMCLLSNQATDTRSYLASKPFHDNVQEGIKMVKDQRLIITGLWRQIGSVAVRRIWDSLNALGSFFRDYQMIMLENDSTDDTKQAIKDVCGEEQRAWCFELNGLGRQALHAGVRDRVKGLTALRQTMLMKIREFDPAGAYNYVMMVDADIFAEGSGGFDIASALSAFTMTSPTGNNADAVCAFQVAGRSANYYDTFAHRGPECKFENLAGQPYCAAQSCGGGMVLYTMAAIHQSMCNYQYINEQTCEHVPFNVCLASHSHGRVFLYKPWSVAMAAGGTRSDWNCVSV
mmetsp:Transcript_1641/g.3590  ORF Transcript_1641/g.3590 Transcript_1641/m.3590 type:complete len:383 (-) Transcript_1641:54-1202(-)